MMFYVLQVPHNAYCSLMKPLALGQVVQFHCYTWKLAAWCLSCQWGWGNLKWRETLQDMAHCIVLCFLTEYSADDMEWSQWLFWVGQPPYKPPLHNQFWSQGLGTPRHYLQRSRSAGKESVNNTAEKRWRGREDRRVRQGRTKQRHKRSRVVEESLGGGFSVELGRSRGSESCKIVRL